ATVALRAGAGQRRDDALGIDLAHRVALALADERVAGAVHAHGAGADEHRLRGGTAIANLGAVHLVPGLAGAGDGGGGAVLQLDAATAPAADVGDHPPALAVGAAVVGLAQHRVRCLAAAPAKALLAGAGRRGNDPRGAVHLAHHGVETIHDVQVAV